MKINDQRRINSHPILQTPKIEPVSFFFNGIKMIGKKGEMITSALIANCINIFGKHIKDKSPQGIFCANGQCAQWQLQPIQRAALLSSGPARPWLWHQEKKNH